MTILELIYATLQDAGISSDDHRYNMRYVFRKIKSAAKELIRQEYPRLVIAGLSQTLHCVEMVPADRDCCKEIDGDFTLLKSVKKLPKPIDAKQSAAITGVYTLAGNRIVYGTYLQYYNSRKMRFRPADPDPFSFFQDGHLYVADYEPIDCLQLFVNGFFENPEEVAYFNEPAGCKPIYEMEFDLPGYLERRVILIVAEELRLRLGIPVDNVNNSKDDTAIEKQTQKR